MSTATSFSKKAERRSYLKYKFEKLNHPKVRSQSNEFIESIYPQLLLTEINIEYNGGFKFHQQYNPNITKLQTLSNSHSTYGAKLFLYMVNLANKRNNIGFKVSLDPHLFTSKKDEASYQSWIHTLEAVVANGYGTLYIGDGSEEKDDQGNSVDRQYVSVFLLNGKSFELLEHMDDAQAPNSNFKVDKKNSVQCVKRVQRGLLEWDEQFEGVRGSRPYKKSLNDLNEFLLGFEFKDKNGVQFDPQMKQRFLIYDNDKKSVRNIWESYGRYTNIVQTMTREDRQLITVCGEPMIEMDYSSNHARIAYELEGVFKGEEFKPYYIDPKDSPLVSASNEAKRAVYKLAMMMLFNSGNPTKSLADDVDNIFEKNRGRTLEEIPSRQKVFRELQQPERQDYSVIIRKIKENNPEIVHYFDGKQSPYLQNLDSRIAGCVMTRLMQQGIPFVSIHDSFLVPKSKAIHLYKAMFDGWEDVLGSKDCCVVDGKGEAQSMIDEYKVSLISEEEADYSDLYMSLDDPDFPF